MAPRTYMPAPAGHRAQAATTQPSPAGDNCPQRARHQAMVCTYLMTPSRRAHQPAGTSYQGEPS